MLMRINSNGEIVVSSSFSILEDKSLVSVSLHNLKHVLNSGEIACEKGFFIPYYFLSVERAETPEEIMFLESLAREFTEYMCPIFIKEDVKIAHPNAHIVKPFYIFPQEIVEYKTLDGVINHMSFREHAVRVMLHDIANVIVKSSESTKTRTLSKSSRNSLFTLETGDDRFLMQDYFEKIAGAYVVEGYRCL